MTNEYSKDEIISILQSEELISFIRKRIEPLIGHYSAYLMPRRKFKSDQNDLNFPVTIKDQDIENKVFFSREQLSIYRKDSIIAGGSLAALINEYLYKVPAVINDIDIFFYKISGANKNIITDMYEISQSGSINFNYCIVESKEVGILNKIQISIGENFSWKNLLQSFDLNSCQIGYNISNNSLIFDINFVNFLTNRLIDENEKALERIKIDGELTTFIRGSIKSRELCAKYYIGEKLINYSIENLLLIKKVNIVDDFKLKDENNIFITKKRLSLWKKNIDILKPWFSLSEENKLILGEIFKKYHWYEFYKNVCEQIYNKKNKGVIDKLGNLDFDFIESVIFLDFFIQRFNDLKKESKGTLENIFSTSKLNIIEQNHFFQVVEKKIHIFRDQVSNNKLNQISPFLNGHLKIKLFIYSLIMNYNYSFKDIIDFCNVFIKKPLYIIGFLENRLDYIKSNDKKYNNDISLLKNKDFYEFYNLIENLYKKELDKDKLIDPISINPFNKFVRELTKHSELLDEGKKLSHCVGGYGNKIKSNKSRIFHIETSSGLSTLELEIKNLKKRQYEEVYFTIIQHKSKHNSNPSIQHKKIAKKLTNYLNNYKEFQLSLKK